MELATRTRNPPVWLRARKFNNSSSSALRCSSGIVTRKARRMWYWFQSVRLWLNLTHRGSTLTKWQRSN